MTDLLLLVLDWFYWPLLVVQPPPWLGYLILGVCLTYGLALAGWALVRAGRSPLWALLLLVTVANLVGIWVFAYIRWPRIDGAGGRSSGDPS